MEKRRKSISSFFHIIIIIFILILSSFVNKMHHVTSINTIKKPPDSAWVLALFPNYRNNINTIDRSGIQRKAAFLLAIEEINNSTEILPNTTIRFGLGDSRRSANRAVEEAARLLELIKEKSIGNKAPIAIIGPASSGPTQLVQRLCNGYKVAESKYDSQTHTYTYTLKYITGHYYV